MKKTEATLQADLSKMSIVHLQNVEILNANAAFSGGSIRLFPRLELVTKVLILIVLHPATDPYIFKITFECLSELEDDLEWKLIYVGSAQSKDYDQELDNCMVGPVPVGELPEHARSSLQ